MIHARSYSKKFPGHHNPGRPNATDYIVLEALAIGLFVFLALSRAGPLGSLNILYTPTAMMVGWELEQSNLATGGSL
jgi:hypothetical protein